MKNKHIKVFQWSYSCSIYLSDNILCILNNKTLSVSYVSTNTCLKHSETLTKKNLKWSSNIKMNHQGFLEISADEFGA